MNRLLVVLSGLAMSVGALACSATVGVGGMVNVPRDAPAKCAQICTDIGTSLAAVVVMASNVGCVCNPPAPPGAAPAAPPPAAPPAPSVPAPTAGKAAGITGGMAAVVVQEQDEERRQNHSAR